MPEEAQEPIGGQESGGGEEGVLPSWSNGACLNRFDGSKRSRNA